MPTSASLIRPLRKSHRFLPEGRPIWKKSNRRYKVRLVVVILQKSAQRWNRPLVRAARQWARRSALTQAHPRRLHAFRGPPLSLRIHGGGGNARQIRKQRLLHGAWPPRGESLMPSASRVPWAYAKIFVNARMLYAPARAVPMQLRPSHPTD